MLSLPESTAVSRPLAKKSFYAKFKLSAAERRRFDGEISQLVIAHEISPRTAGIAAGPNIGGVFVLRVLLKGETCDRRNLLRLAQLTGRHLLFVLERREQARLALMFSGELLQSAWRPAGEWAVTLRGPDLDALWEDLAAQVSGVSPSAGRALSAQLALDKERAGLSRRMAMLEKKLAAEKQFNRKMELNTELKKLRQQQKELGCGGRI